MLELRNIIKDYKVGDRKFRALKGIDLEFNKGEFVAILGPSGCGKTTTLNIIGGLDRYTDGDLIINGTSTKEFKDRDWDAYRNHSIGFVFQSYNLINHLSVLDNVELGMTLSGVSQSDRRQRALEVLERVGLKEQVNKRPTKLSGGEKQRVAIARALVNDPDIILADEPTGALDSKTAREILDLIKEISNEKLVIMVTHARMYAEEYASRIVELKDGEVMKETGTKVKDKDAKRGYHPKRIAMNFLTALKLSFNNLRTKKLRTVITALASSVGIIGVGLVLSISNGFSAQIEDIESDQLVGLPIIIGREETSIGFDQAGATEYIPEDYTEDTIVPYDPSSTVHENLLTQEFLTYLESMDEDIYTNIHYEFGYSPTLLVDNNDTVEVVSTSSLSFSNFIVTEEQLPEYYNLKAGAYPSNVYEVVLLVDNWNVVDQDIVEALGLDVDSTIHFDDVLGMNLYVALNDDYYIEQGGIYVPNYADLETVRDNGVELTIVGIVEATEDALEFNSSGIKYLYELKDELIVDNMDSNICTVQSSSSDSVFSLNPLTDAEKENLLAYLGCNNEDPFLIQIYTDSVENKEAIKAHIATFNEGRDIEDKIFETDLAEAIGETLNTLITSISVVLTAFASISLVVSSIMIGVIIYISVLERTKEIGIIRSLGGRKKDISRVFNAESVLIGLFAGILGVVITYVLTFPINAIAVNYDESLANVAQVNIIHLIVLIIISTVLTFIGGLIPSRIAAKKDPVEALRVE
jgi:putative ABC transport system permease protein